MEIEIESTVDVDVIITGSVSDTENAHDIRVTTRVKLKDKWYDCDITGHFTPAEIQKFATKIEDKYRQGKEDERDFGRGEAV